MSLPSRKRQESKPTPLPKEFLASVSKLFQKQFRQHTKTATFLVYGSLYSNEAVLCLSLADPKSLKAASIHLSTDLAKDVASEPSIVTNQLKGMVDVAASWFAQCFESGIGLAAVLKEMEGMEANWQELDWEGSKLFVLVNRNNYALEKAANALLKKSGFTDEGEDLLDELNEEASEDDHNLN